MSTRMNKLSFIRAGLAALALVTSAGAALAQSTVTLTAAPASAALPDGQSVPMWGYFCGAVSTGVTCTAMNGLPQTGGTSWQPPLIRVPAGSTLTITLTNQLSFGTTTDQLVPTSIVIDGLVGGGLGDAPSRMPSPSHALQGTTWPGALGGIDPATAAITVTNGGLGYVNAPSVTITGGSGTGATGVARIAGGIVTGVVVSSPGSGYVSGDTLTVTIGPPPCTISATCVQATATIDATILAATDGSATFVPPAQADRVRSFATEVAAGASNNSLTWSNLRPGTYLIHSGTQPSIQHPMGLYGVLVVTDPTAPGTAYGVAYDADLPLLLSEIDPAQNVAVDTAVRTAGFNATVAWAGPGACKGGAVACYPPAVNYSPRYYLINGTSFDRTNLPNSTLAVPAAGASGNLLVRIVNAGQRMHAPAVVGANLALLAEDGNPVSKATGVQASIPMPPGKTFDAVIRPTQTTTGTYDPATLPVFDRQLSLSTNNQRDGGMQAYIAVAGGAAIGGVGSSSSGVALSASDPTFYCVAGTTLAVTDVSKGVLAGAVGASGVSAPTALGGNLTATNFVLNSDGTFTYTQASTDTTCGGTFQYLVNGSAAHTATIVECDASTGSDSSKGCAVDTSLTANDFVVVSQVASRFASSPPGVLSYVTNAGGLSLSAVEGGGVNKDGSFAVAGPGASANCPTSGAVASQVPAGATCVAMPYTVKNAQGATSTATGYVAFLSASGLKVAVTDGPTGKPVTDYRWIIEEDRTFWVDPKCQVNDATRPTDSFGRNCPPLPVESIGYNFHSAHMPVIATGCVGTVSCEAGQTVQGVAAACDIGNGVCRTGATQKTPTSPGDVHLDPNKHYFISILPGDAINPTISGFGGTIADCGAFDPGSAQWKLYSPADGSSGNCGHEMGGTQITPNATAVTVKLQQIPLPTAKISVFVFQDDNPLNGENDAGGGVDVIAPAEPGLGGFEVKLFDQAGQLGDNTGQITYDEFNQPVSNALAGYIDPRTNMDACPITTRTDGLIGMIPTCPKYESDGVTPSPLAGQVVIDHLYPGLYEIQAYPAADRIARGEQWLQTNTLDGGKPHEAFIIPNEPGYFQEFGPGGFHVAIGFANPAIINARKDGYCASALVTGPCNNTLQVEVTNNHMSRTPDQRTFDSGTYDHYGFTQCYVSVGPADSEDFAFQSCVLTTDANGKTHAMATFTGMPAGVFKMTVFDQWNDIMLDGLVGTVEVGGGGTTTYKKFPVTQWRTNLYTRTYIDTDGSGVSDDSKPGLALVNTNIRYRDGSIGFFNNTDLNGYAGFNEVFPLMNWLVVETSQTRFKPTWTHSVYDAGGPVDCTTDTGILGSAPTPPCSTIAANLANTDVRVPLPAELRVPGAKYCDSADCPSTDGLGGASTGSLFPPQAFGTSMGWQGLLGQNTFMEFGVKPFKKADPTANTPAENGGIYGQVIYASTRPFDDPSLLLQLQWEPGIPNATINLYSKTVDAQGNEVLKLVDTTQTASWDDWSQGFRKGADGVTLLQAADGGYIPNMNCPGQDATSPFFATLKNSKMWLDAPDSNGNKKALAYQSQFKCYDGWSQLNQAQPAPYDGYYKFPSVVAIDPATGKSSRSNCTACVANPDDGTPMLPPGKYVVEVKVPTGYELVKEEDKNILMGDVYVAPVTQQFAGFGNIFIMPDQASVNSYYNANNPGGLNTTNTIGSVSFPRHEGDTGSIEAFWPCVGALRQVPDFNSEFPGAQQAAPFAGAMRRLCDRKEVNVADESSTLAKFYLFSDTHIAGHFAGTITNDFASEFDPFSPQFGEKFGPPNLPVGLRDFNGNEVARVYADQWGIYNGLYFSTWSPNPPNPTGYAPQMSISCMNDPGPIQVGVDSTGAPIMGTDPAYNPAYSNFCYEQPFMPGETTYMDTPVIPTQSFADGYNLPDTEYPAETPAVLKVVNSSSGEPQGPWVHTAVNAVTAATATASFSVSGVRQCTATNCTNPTSITFPGGTVTCTSDGNGGPNCSGGTNNNRSTAVATYVRGHSSALLAGLTVTGSGTTVNVAAPATGASYNGTVVVSATAGFANFGASPTAPVTLSGGRDAAPAQAAAMGITITALGNKTVQNPYYAGPNATGAPFNQKAIVRHYGFGSSQGTGSAVLVAPDGTTTASLTVTGWNDTTITATVPSNLSNAFNCPVQQRGSTTAKCGELVITRGDNGKRSIDAITVTVGGSTPWVVTEKTVTAPGGKVVHDYGKNFGRLNLVLGATYQSPIQVALDSADPGDLILVQPGTYRENLIMWKPVRLQGVGAASVTVNADAHPAGHMDQWRRQMVCVFGLTLNGIPNLGNDQGAFDPTGQYACPNAMWLKGDRIPFEAITGWQASGNGNLAQVLQEPTLLGAYEGAGITVVGRGIRAPNGSTDFWGDDPTAAGAFPDGAVYLTNSNTDCTSRSGIVNGTDYGTSNYLCNPSRIDGLSILNSSQGGGGLFIHGWAHHLDVANNRISANHGTLAGAINLGNGETPPVYVNDGTTCGAGTTALCPPIPNNTPTGATVPFAFNTFVRIHHNMLWNNASIGDALFTGTPAGAGGVTVSAGGDNFKIDHNWIAGNLSTGDGGGVQTLGVSFNGTIANNYVLFNQSTNPTLPTNGGGIVIQGANEPRTLNGTECGGSTDADCPPGLGDGTGDGLTIDGNLIYGNSAESGTGGGIALEQINGSEVIAFPRSSNRWYGVTLTNNIIANNVAGYDGGGVSMRDALKVSVINNTIASNDTTASAGVLFKTLGAINASNPPPGCNSTTDPTLPQDPSCLGRDAPHGPQPSGLVTMAHTQNLNDAISALPGSLTSNNNPKLRCPGGFGYANGTNGSSVNNADCVYFSRPLLVNDLFWQNRSFHVNLDTVTPNTGLTSQQNLIVMATGAASSNTQIAPQQTSGACPAGASFWDIGLRTDDVQAHLLCHPGSGCVNPAIDNRLAVTYSVLTGTGDISGLSEVVTDGSDKVGAANPLVGQVCNGARVPPEYCPNGIDVTGGQNGAASCKGYNAPVGASETTSTSTLFVFNGIQPTATVDEGHNWLNLVYGPLYLGVPGASGATKAEQLVASPSVGTAGSAYSLVSGSAASFGGAPQSGIDHDFFGNPRPTGCGAFDIGAVQSSSGATCTMTITKTDGRTTLYRGDTTTYTIVVTNSGAAPVTGAVVTDSRPSAFPNSGWSWTCAAGAGADCGGSSSGSGSINATLGTLAAGSHVTFTVTARVSTTVTNGQTVTNTATVTYPNGTGTNSTTSASDADTVVVGAGSVAFTATSLGSIGTVNGVRTVTLGQRSGATAFTVTATVTGGSVTFGAATLSSQTFGAANTPYYTVTTDNCSGKTIATNGTCTVSFSFAAPTGNSTTQRTGSFSLIDSAAGSPQVLNLTGS
ncbi:MAG: DUF11 domain-containing protein [Proteobacteria bacterium]|nr:DUF11 domain-containing protein [Pseudomonadota bacterium]